MPFVAPWTAFHHKYRVTQWRWREIFRVRRLKGERFAVGVSARWDPRDHMLLCGVGARRRLGFPRSGSRVFLTDPLAQPKSVLHRHEHWRVLAQALGFDLPCSVGLSPLGRPPQGRILVHSGAGQSVRVWPLDRYRDLVTRLRERRYRVQVVCDADQEHWWAGSGENTVVSPRTVTELIALINEAGAFIGNDSGPGHLAASFGVPSFTIFGPQMPEFFAPLQKASQWIEGKPCPYKPCLDDCRLAAPRCLWDLSTDDVWPKLERFVDHHQAALQMEEPVRLRATSYRTPRPRRFIQVFCRYLKRGGEEISVARIARHLELGGHKVVRFWRASAEWTGPEKPLLWKQVLLAWRNHTVLVQLREKHRRFKPDAWIFHNIVPVVSLGAYRLAQQLNVPVIRWIHNHRPISPSGTMFAGGQLLKPEDPLLAWKEVWHGTWHGRMGTAGLALGYAGLRWRGDFDAVKAWLAISAEMQETFLRAGFPSDRLFCLHHSWDIHPPMNPDGPGGYFLFLGRMVEEKGVRFLLDLWQRPELKGLGIVLAGEGPLADEWRDKTLPNIRWAGFVQGDEKRRLIAESRAVLLPCLAPEALGLVVYEAYEQGRPVLASALGGLKDIVRDGVTGRLLTPGDKSAWARAILEHALDADLSRRRGQHGLQWLNDTVSPSAWNRRFDEIIDHALFSSGSRIQPGHKFGRYEEVV